MAALDLFEHYKNQPPALKAICDKYSEDDFEYVVCEKFLNKVEEIGYTFDYGLDAVPYDLHKIKD